jgi:hypothetical protein
MPADQMVRVGIGQPDLFILIFPDQCLEWQVQPSLGRVGCMINARDE